MSLPSCDLCGEGLADMSAKGKYLRRTSPVGGPFVGQCAPSCTHTGGTRDDAILAAVGVAEEGEG
jgi:hypothetical protein